MPQAYTPPNADTPEMDAEVERLIALFKKYEKEPPYRLTYQHRTVIGHAAHERDIYILQHMIARGLVHLVKETASQKIYEYTPKP